MSPAWVKYSVTTLEPGARLVFTQGLVVKPRSAAFLARMPAASMTDGFDVFVQLVMAAMTTCPCCAGKLPPACPADELIFGWSARDTALAFFTWRSGKAVKN